MERGGDGGDAGWVGAGPDDDLEARLAAEEAAVPVDLARPHVMTVLGPIDPGALGITLLLRSGAAGRPMGDDARFALLADLEDFYAVGGRAVLDVGIDGPERNEALRWVAARAPVHLVARSGVPWEGADGARVGISVLDINRTDDVATEALGDSLRGGDWPLLVVGEAAAVVAGVGAAIGRGKSRRRVVGYPVAAAGAGLVEARRVLATGAVLAVEADGAATTAEGWGETAERIAGLVGEGFGDRLLLGVASPPGAAGVRTVPLLSALLERLPVALMAAGLDALAVRRLLVENPAAVLTIDEDEEGGAA